MHKSKLGGFIIDCRMDDLEAGQPGFRRAGDRGRVLQSRHRDDIDLT